MRFSARSRSSAAWPRRFWVWRSSVFELIVARAEPLLLGFEFVQRTRRVGLGGRHFAQSPLEPLGFGIELLRLAREHDSQRAAHLFAQFRIAPRLRSLPLERRELFFDFDENVVHAREISRATLRVSLRPGAASSCTS